MRPAKPGRIASFGAGCASCPLAAQRAVSEITNQLAVLIVRILAGVVGFSFA